MVLLKTVPCFGFCFWFAVPWLCVLPALGCDDVRPVCEIQSVANMKVSLMDLN